MSREEFCNNYIDVAVRGMALVSLPPGDKTLEEWRSLWSRTLNSPAQ